MMPRIKQECVDVIDEVGDNDADDNRYSDEDDSSSCSDEEPDDPTTDEHSSRQTIRKSLHVSVQRHDISAVQVQEGNEELQGLGVDVYDQQTYEQSVFDQVDRVISRPSDKDSVNDREPMNQSSIGDFMRIIHSQPSNSPDPNDEEQVQERDEEILRLARQHRLSRQDIKKEKPDGSSSSQSATLPRVPKIKIERSADNSFSSRSIPSTSELGQVTAEISVKSEKIDHPAPTPDIDLNIDEELSSIDGDNSSASEYRPEKEKSASEESEDDINLDDDRDYETDSDDNNPFANIKESQAESKGKKIKDDGDIKVFAARIKAYNKERAKLRLQNIDEDGVESKKLDEMVKVDGNLQIPKSIWDNLFEHQKTGVRWFWELHQLGTGGILGDEMGLGKTIQMIAFLVALKTSKIINMHNNYANLGPTVLVCPATVMHQWLQEFRKWYPPFRVAILHSTGTFSGDKKELVRVIHKSNGILICSYPGVIIYQDYLHALDWHYAILDEGHKIKNPDSQVTLACKRFRTPHRIILSGSPVQNNLRELWSIFDFIYPGKLGTLPVFLGQFAIPITQGGYANATDMQVQIAYKCACVLRNTIKPFLLRRHKAEVNSKLKLPERSEQVLFCKLTDKQRQLYQHYLDSPTVRDIKRGMLQIFVGLIGLRKICNHPDIFDASECNRQVKQTQRDKERQMKHLEFFSVDETYGHYQKSGKMMVVDALLKLWKKQGDKVLLFTQSRQMLKIFTRYLNEKQYKHLSMDGATPIGIRHSLIDDFNNDPDVFVFLLTTRVGGVGVNLIGANRIIIYDPDWNPSTDIQARERAWRIGQKRRVIIYRLLTAGTIEEKIYHRQVFKLYLTNRILKDAKQKRFFKTNDLHELFTLGHDEKNIETKALFDDDLQIDESEIKKMKKKDKKRKKMKLETKSNRQISIENEHPKLPEEKLKELRERAKKLSQMIELEYAQKESPAQLALSNEPNTSNSTCTGLLNVEPLDVIDDSVPDRMGIYKGHPVSPSKACQPISPTRPLPYCAQSVTPSVALSRNKEQTGQEIDIVKKKKSKKSLKRVEYLVKQDVYKPCTSVDSGKNDNDPEKESLRHKRDDYILGHLFKSSNIFGALKHDKIENDSTADFKVVESEAERVARDAIRALRESRRMCIDSTYGIPNWTGRNGQLAGSSSTTNRLVPKNKFRAQQMARSASFTTSSVAKNATKPKELILSSIKKRNQANPVRISSGRSGHAVDSEENDDDTNRDFRGRSNESDAEAIADKIRTFVLFQSASKGEAQTGEVLDFFKRTFKPEQTAVFKAILYKMCEFNRRGDQGFWRLKSDFRDV